MAVKTHRFPLLLATSIIGVQVSLVVWRVTLQFSTRRTFQTNTSRKYWKECIQPLTEKWRRNVQVTTAVLLYCCTLYKYDGRVSRARVSVSYVCKYMWHVKLLLLVFCLAPLEKHKKYIYIYTRVFFQSLAHILYKYRLAFFWGPS